ncbi:vWA domain-containing protein [Desulfosporosinus nitroreducens]|uniref:VWA-like domain-containing protein n=1 Tax=Desulfosporosinus nitroreducens TaxID=2018668 RepID=A0ABT8QSW9_9FIRM|nr:VWA-like domain-containing protein [Desulfosporosinus nitroreducens]MDO0823158.1 VWA-like domain-containing protein [Desulfosporosinus nitroreducens]
MDSFFDNQVKELYEKADIIINNFLKAKRKDENSKVNIPKEFKEEFFSLVDKVNLSLMEDKDNFYGYFLMQMSREIRFDISSPTAVNFKGAKYVIYFNPIIFLNLNIKQMESTIKHEILHILSRHLIRAKEFKGGYSTLAINLAMNIVVNTYLDHLPPYSVTLEWVNLNYSLNLLPFKPFEYYAEEIQTALDLLEADEDAADESDTDDADDSNDKAGAANDAAADPDQDETIETEYNPEKAHDLWADSSDIDEKTLQEFTEKFIDNAQKGSIPNYLESMISSLKNSKGELPWNLYLKRLMGTVESNKKKTISRRNRRQPERLDIRGQLRSHKAKIVVALDISGSIGDQEFNQAIREVLAIVKNYNHEITIIECDSEIRRVYNVKSVKDLKDRSNIRGGTKFTPVFEYANKHKVNLLVYFTDGKGEEKLLTIPRGYKTLWVISGRGDKLSLKEAYGAVKKLKNVEIKDDSLKMSDVKREGFSMQDQESMGI